MLAVRANDADLYARQCIGGVSFPLGGGYEPGLSSRNGGVGRHLGKHCQAGFRGQRFKECKECKDRRDKVCAAMLDPVLQVFGS